MNIIGKTIHGYKIQKRIGKGGMGSVYLAKHTTLDKEVAIKIVNLGSDNDSEMALRFKREAKLHLSLGRHPNIIELENYIVEDNHYIFMQYFESVELATVIGKQTGPMPYKRAMPIFKQILSGIGHTHDVGIIHRDIKPPNILINNNDEIKIADYGIAIQSSSSSFSSSEATGAITQKGVVVGSPTYMSPEQILAMDLDYSTDIYLLGITFYEVLAGRPPFDPTTLSITEIKKAHINTAPEDPRKYYPDIPENVVSAVMVALSKNQGDRQESCKEFLSNLEGRSKVSTVSTNKPSPSKEKIPKAKKNNQQKSSKSDSGNNSTLMWVASFVVVILFLIIINEANNLRYDAKGTSDRTAPTQQISKPFDVNACYKKGEKLYKNNKFTDAVKQFTLCLDNEPKNYNSRFYRAQAYYNLNKYGNAEEDASYLVNNYGKNNDFRLRATIRYTRRDWKGAIEDYDYLIEEAGVKDPELFKNNGKSNYEYSEFEKGKSHYGKAILGFRKIEKAKSDLAESYYGRALCRAGLKNPEYKDAVKDLKQALKIEPKNAEYRFARAKFNRKRNKTNKACEDLNYILDELGRGYKDRAENLIIKYRCN